MTLRVVRCATLFTVSSAATARFSSSPSASSRAMAISTTSPRRALLRFEKLPIV